MQFPYTQRSPGHYRPMTAVWLFGPATSTLADGLLDTGADCVLISGARAQALGIDVGALPSRSSVRSMSGARVPCKTAKLVIGLRSHGIETYWYADVAIFTTPINYCYWGIQGFLEFFRAEFDGPQRVVTLTAGSNLPVAPAPP